jgi:hypothetical protein
LPTHRTYADEQDAADQAYATECGKRTLSECNTGATSLQRRERERAYRKAINAILQHLTEQGLNRTDPRNQTFVYLLGSDSEKADLRARAIRFYHECARVLSNPVLTRDQIPVVVEDGNAVSAKSACETAEARLGGGVTASAYQTETTVTVKTVTDTSGHDEDTWTFVAVSTEPEPVLDVTHQGGLDNWSRPAEVAGRAVTGERAANAAVLEERTGRANEAAAKAAQKQADADAKAAKKQVDAVAKAAKEAADAPAKAARKEERDRARAERAARREEEAKEHKKKD